LELASKRLNPSSGRVGNEILLFFDDFESLANANNFSDTVKLGTLPLFLDSFPRSIVNSLRTESYADAKAALIKQFLPPGNEDRAILEFHERVQKKNESVDEYLHHLRKMAARAYPSVQANDLETQMKVNFMKGLLPRYRPHMMMFGSPKTLKEAIERAKAVEYPFMDFGTQPSISHVITATNLQSKSTDGQNEWLLSWWRAWP